MRLERAGSLEEVAPSWPGLAAASGNVFATWDWVHAWWEHFGRNRELVVLSCRRSDGATAAIVPLYLANRRGARILRFLGHGPSDQLGPVCDPDDWAAVMGAVQGFLEGPEVRWDLLIADELPAAPRRSLVGWRDLAHQSSPVSRLDGGYPAWLSRRSPNLRAQLRRASAALARRGNVEYRITTEAEHLGADLAAMERLHDARWRRHGGSRAFAGRMPFHRDVAGAMLAEDRLRLRTLTVDGRPVAALYNLRFDGAESFYQSGRDPAYDDCSVGLLLHAHAIRESCEEGLGEYRLLRGAEPYKRRLADDDPGLASAVLTRTSVGRLLAAAVAVEPSLPRWARRRVPSALAWGTGGSPIWGKP